MSEEVSAPEAVAEEVSSEVEAPITEEVVEGSSEESAPITGSVEGEEVQATTESELETEIADAIEDGASEEEVQNMVRQFVLKVDGREFIKEIDMNDEDELTKQFQLAAKGQKSMQELQELKNAYNAELQRLVKDPFAVLKELDGDFDPLKLSADYINRRHEESQQSPEEKAQQEAQTELQELRAERDRLKQEKEDDARAKEDAAVASEIETDIMSALDGDSELVADRETVRLVARELHWAMKNGHFDMTAKDVLPTVKDQLRQQFQKSAGRFKSTAALKEYMGSDLLSKLRDERMELAQAQDKLKTVGNIKKDVAQSEEVKKERKKIKLSDLMA
jgi:hypothetical protein